MTRILPVFIGLILASACSTTKTIDKQELTVACGMCILKSEPRGCYWAAEMGEKVLPVVGPGVPTDHDSHGPGGMCTQRRRAVITGTVDDERIVADAFELLPAESISEGAVHDHEH